MTVITDPTDERLAKQHDETSREQAEVYLVLSKEEIDKGFVRPYRRTYRHAECGQITKMAHEIAATFSRDPAFYSGTYCTYCCKHRPVEEFTWEDESPVGS